MRRTPGGVRHTGGKQELVAVVGLVEADDKREAEPEWTKDGSKQERSS